MFRNKRTTLAGLAVLCVTACVTAAQVMTTTALAQEASADEARVPAVVAVSLDRLTRRTEPIKAFTVASITDVTAELGFAAGVVAIEDDYPLIIVRDERGAGFAIQPMVCDGNAPDDTCQGLLLAVILQGGTRFPGISLNQVNQFNDLQYFGRAHMTGDMTGPENTGQGATGQEMAILTRLVLGNYGTTRGNLGVELTTFRSAVYNYAQYLSQVRFADGGGADIMAGSQLQSPAHSLAQAQAQARVAPGVTTPFAAPSPGRTGLRPAPSLSGAAEFDADLARLIALWGRTGILADLQVDLQTD